MRVVIRADATPSIGTGHVMRCWALAEEFSEVGAQVTWQGEFSVPWVAEALRRAGWGLLGGDPWESVDPSDVAADIVVVDSYQLPGTYRRTLLESGKTVVAVVDHHHRDLGPGSYWVNPGPPLGTRRQPGFMDGVDYVLIRREIRDIAALRHQLGVENQVTFLFGGTDSLGLGASLEELALGLPLYAGPGAGHGGDTRWLPAGRELLEHAVRSRLVVSTASVTSWEMLHAGVPLAVICAVDNQRGNYDWLTSQGWATGLEPSHNLGLQVARALERALLEPHVGSTRVDGFGARRVVRRVLEGAPI